MIQGPEILNCFASGKMGQNPCSERAQHKPKHPVDCMSKPLRNLIWMVPRTGICSAFIIRTSGSGDHARIMSRLLPIWGSIKSSSRPINNCSTFLALLLP